MKNRARLFTRLINIKSDYSAKIAAGILGWLITVIIVCYSAWLNIEMPGTVELFMVLSCALLGLDTLENVFTAFFSKYKRHLDELHDEN